MVIGMKWFVLLMSVVCIGLFGCSVCMVVI